MRKFNFIWVLFCLFPLLVSGITPTDHSVADGTQCKFLVTGLGDPEPGATNGKASVAPPERFILPVSEFHYQIFGENNSETIVLLHGMEDSSETWLKVAPLLAKHYRVIIIDQRGHGKTPGGGEDYSPTAMAEDLKRVLDHLGVKKVHLVGHSMAARTVVRFAELFADCVSSVVVIDMFFKGLERWLGKGDRTLAVIRADRPAPRVLTPAEIAALYQSQGVGEDMTASLKRVSAPIAVIGGDDKVKGTVLRGEGIRHLRETRPDVPFWQILGASHKVHHYDEIQFTAIVEVFIISVTEKQ